MPINEETGNIKLEDLGFNDFFASNRSQLGLVGFPLARQSLGGGGVARVIAEHKGGYRVKNENGEYLARVTGKQMFNAASREDYPAVGDWVAITELNKEQAVIHRVLPRQTVIKRKHGDKNKTGDKPEIQVIGANINVAFIVESVDRDYNLNRFERYLAIAENGGVEPAMILNKIDLLSNEELGKKLTELKNRFPGVNVILTSTVNDKGLDELKNYIAKGKTYCFLGSSGVGKSSLINKLLNQTDIKTGDIGSYSGRGKHVTTSRQMYFLKDGGIVIDNPGTREVGIADTSAGIDGLFDEITALAGLCKYSDCTHTHEPGCEVLSAVKSGKLDKNKYSNYVGLKKETKHYEMTKFEKREKNRQFGKFIKNAKKELKK